MRSYSVLRNEANYSVHLFHFPPPHVCLPRFNTNINRTSCVIHPSVHLSIHLYIQTPASSLRPLWALRWTDEQADWV